MLATCPFCLADQTVPGKPGRTVICDSCARPFPAPRQRRSAVDSSGTRSGSRVAGKVSTSATGAKPDRDETIILIPDDANGDMQEAAAGGTGRVVNRYRVIEEISHGGMGAVYRARDRSLQREVALKVIRDPDSSDRAARFVLEAQITGQLEHPNIVPVHELGVGPGGRPFFAMKLVRGRTLASILAAYRHDAVEAAREFPLTRMLRFVVDVCNAVGFAHARGVIHRDIKPANIMVGDFGEVMLMDWGLAKVVAGGAVGSDTVEEALPPSGDTSKIQRLRPEGIAIDPDASSGTLPVPGEVRNAPIDATHDGAVLGTPVYMPPEQASGRIAEMDARSDIYSLGAILYEIITLHPPVDGRDVNEVLMNVIGGNIIDPARRAGRAVPKDLAAVALTALAKDPARRYRSAIAMRRDIESFIEGRAVSVGDGNHGTRLVRVVRRNRRAALVVALSVVVLVVALAVAFGSTRAVERERRAVADVRSELEHERKRVRVADERQRSDRAQVGEAKHLAAIAMANEQLVRGDHTNAATALAGSPVELRDWVWRRLDLLTQPHLACFRERTEPLTALAASGDGAVAAVAGSDGMVDLYDLRTQRRTGTNRLHPGRIRALAVDQAGGLVASGGDDGAVRLWQPGSAGTPRTLTGHEAPLTALAFASAGSAFASGDASGVVRAWNLANGGDAVLGRLDSGVAAVRIIPGDDGDRVVAASAEGRVATWRLASRQEIARRRIDGRTLAINADGTRLLVAASDGVRSWDLVRLEAGIRLEGQAPVTVAAFAPNGRIVTAGNDATVRVWDAGSGRMLLDLYGHQGRISGLGVTMAGNGPEQGWLVLSAGADGSFRLWDGQQRRDRQVVALGQATCAAVSADGRRAVVGNGGSATVWDLATRRPVQTVLLGRQVRAVALAPDGRAVAVPGDAGVARVWSDRGGQVLANVQIPPAALVCISFSPDGSSFATGGADGRVRAWKTEGGAEIGAVLIQSSAQSSAHRGTVAALAFAPDGKSLASLGGDGGVRVAALPDGQVRRQFEAGDGGSTSLAWLDDGESLVVGSERGAVIWRLADGSVRNRLTGHGAVAALVSGDGGRRLFTTTGDGAIRVWDPQGGRSLLACPAFDSAPLALMVANDHDALIAVLANGTAVIHPVTPAAPANP